jgi:hypothetical protein
LFSIQAKFPSTFPLLKSLYLDCSGAHGDNGSPIERLLHGLPNLQVLHIQAPSCDLESCRIQGLTWTYTYPQLEHFAISIFYRSAQDIASFLANHPKIRTLEFNAEGEEPIPNVNALLPDLEALSMEDWGQTYHTQLLNANSPRKITYFKAGRCPFNQYCLIPQYAPLLQCLELSLNIENIRNQSNQYSTIKNLLALLPDLSELAIRFSSSLTSMPQTDGTYRNPLPMVEEILSKILKALPPSGKLQVLRMKDRDNGKGSPLAVQSGTFTSLREIIPSSLEVLQWGIENSTVRYKLEPEGSVRIVDPPENRQWPDMLLWTDSSILNHLQH